MGAQKKWYLIVALLLLVVLVALQWPSAFGSRQSASVVPAERLIREKRPIRHSQTRESHRTRDFRTIIANAAKGEFSKLSRNEIEAFLSSRQRSAESLLSAFRLSGDEVYLTEALQKFPSDCQVLFASLRLSGDPAENLKTLDALKLADPGNGIGNCLASKALFDMGRGEEALQELLRMSGKPIDDYTVISCQNDEEAYASAGFSNVESKITSLYSATKPGLMKLGAPLVKKLDAMREVFDAEGDQAAAESIRRIQSEIAGRLRNGTSLIDEMIGIAHEKAALKGLESPEAGDRLREIEQHKTTLVDAARKIPKLMENPTVPEGDWISYFDRVKLFGEKAANSWILERYPE